MKTDSNNRITAFIMRLFLMIFKTDPFLGDALPMNGSVFVFVGHNFIIKDGGCYMCTALTYKTKQHYFGRNLDLERGYGERVVITPRNYPFTFRYEGRCDSHFAMIGMAAVVDNYPLYFEATNEKGLSIAGLNFPGNAYYPPYVEGKINIAPFELIPYLLSLCENVDNVIKKLNNTNVANCNFSEKLPVSPLHWLISDSEKSVTLECTKAGIKIHENIFGVLTNNPTFDYHVININNFMHLHSGAAENKVSKEIPMENYSLGMGAIGLPGDFSSASRFIKTVFVKENSVCDEEEKESVNQFFHILMSVAMPKGCVMLPNGEFEYTRYSSCCNVDTGVYYYLTYEDSAIQEIRMNEANLSSKELI